MSSFDLASSLLDAGAVRLSPKSPFTWASGLRSPIYCDNRQLLGFPDIRNQIKTVLAERVAESKPAIVAGTATAGIAWAALVADQLGLPMAYVRPEPKKHGMGRQVEGPHVDGHRVVLVEDLFSTGGSSLKCVEALRHEDAEVVEVLGLFSYGLPQAEEVFRSAGVKWRVLATFEVLVERAREKKMLDAQDLASLAEWREDTVAWSRRHE